MTKQEKLAMIDKNHKNLSLGQQCKLLELHRSNLYYVASQESKVGFLIIFLLKGYGVL